MTDSIFQRSPRNMRIASWVLAGSIFAVWWRHDRKKEREFSDNEIAQWNQDVLNKTHTKSEKQRAGKE